MKHRFLLASQCWSSPAAVIRNRPRLARGRPASRNAPIDVPSNDDLVARIVQEGTRPFACRAGSVVPARCHRTAPRRNARNAARERMDAAEISRVRNGSRRSRELQVRRWLDARADDASHAGAAATRDDRRLVGVGAGNERTDRGQRRVSRRAHALPSSIADSRESCAAPG